MNLQRKEWCIFNQIQFCSLEELFYCDLLYKEKVVRFWLGDVFLHAF